PSEPAWTAMLTIGSALCTESGPFRLASHGDSESVARHPEGTIPILSVGWRFRALAEQVGPGGYGHPTSPIDPDAAAEGLEAKRPAVAAAELGFERTTAGAVQRE